MDVHSKAIRSKNMRAIGTRDTAIEKRLAGLLNQLEIAWQPQGQGLPGRPDFVISGYRAVIFTHGCFWHHHSCYLFRLPATRTAFWLEKITANARRDEQAVHQLLAGGWRVLIVWECALRGKQRRDDHWLNERIEEWLCEGGALAQIDAAGIHGAPLG